MIRVVPVRLSSQYLDGSPMYPGVWLQVWLFNPCLKVWSMVDLKPDQPSDDNEAA